MFFKKNNSILLTGSNSFIGRKYLEKNSQNDVKIISTYRNIKPLFKSDNIIYKKFDLFKDKYNYVSKKFKKPDTLIHLAWDFLPDFNNINHIDKNYQYSYKFIHELIKNGCNNINIIGSHQEAGNKEGKIPENFIDLIPNNNYSAAKQLLYFSINELRKKYNFDLKWIRIFNLYGKNTNHGLFRDIHSADKNIINLTTGNQQIDLIDINTCIDNINLISNSNQSGVFNIGSGKPVRLKNFIEKYKKINNLKVKTKYGKLLYKGPNKYYADIKNTNSLKHKKKIRVSQSFLDNKELLNIEDTLKSSFLGQGNKVIDFENKIHKFIGNEKKYIACVSSGTSALQLAIDSMQLPKNSEIIIPSITFFASCQAVLAAKMKPVICDIDLSTATLNIESLKKNINSKTKAVMHVHYASNFGKLSEVYKIAKKNNLRVIEDAAHSFGSIYNGKKVGYYGDITCFSFDGIKNITSGEGGAILTSSKKMIKNIKILRNLGIYYDSKNRIDVKANLIGGRFHMSNINASIGLAQLKKINFIEKKRIKIASYYQKNLSKINQIKFLNINYSKDKIIPHIMPLLIDGKYRNKLKNFLEKNCIETRTNYFPLHKLSLFKKTNYYCPEADKFAKQVLIIPIHPNLELQEVDFVIDKICKFFKNK